MSRRRGQACREGEEHAADCAAVLREAVAAKIDLEKPLSASTETASEVSVTEPLPTARSAHNLSRSRMATCPCIRRAARIGPGIGPFAVTAVRRRAARAGFAAVNGHGRGRAYGAPTVYPLSTRSATMALTVG